MKCSLGPLRSCCIYITLVSVMTTCAVLLGPYLEARLLPVVTDVSARKLNGDDGETVVALGANKLRLGCRHVETDFIVTTDSKIAPVFSHVITRLSVPTAAGQQSLGIYRIRGGGSVSISVIAEHRCHPLWKTRTVLFENVNLEDIPTQEIIR